MKKCYYYRITLSYPEAEDVSHDIILDKEVSIYKIPDIAVENCI